MTTDRPVVNPAGDAAVGPVDNPVVAPVIPVVAPVVPIVDPIVNILGERVALGPLRKDLVPTYYRWMNDFETMQ